MFEYNETRLPLSDANVDKVEYQLQFMPAEPENMPLDSIVLFSVAIPYRAVFSHTELPEPFPAPSPQDRIDAYDAAALAAAAELEAIAPDGTDHITVVKIMSGTSTVGTVISEP